MTNLKNDLKQFIHDKVYQFKEEPFTLASGRKSNHYFNLKMLTMNPQGLQLLVDVLYDEISLLHQKQPFDCLAGMTMGPDPFIYALALKGYANNKEDSFFKPIIVRKKAKGHGTGKQVEGIIDGLKTPLLVDDVITTAGSILEAYSALLKTGLTISYAYCIIDRQEGGAEALADKGIQMFSLFKKEDFST